MVETDEAGEEGEADDEAQEDVGGLKLLDKVNHANGIDSPPDGFGNGLGGRRD